MTKKTNTNQTSFIIDNKSPFLKLPLPSHENDMGDDVFRIIESFTKLDTHAKETADNLANNTTELGVVSTKADTAQESANTAQESGANAQTTANTAVSKADAAQATADDALAKTTPDATTIVKGKAAFATATEVSAGIVANKIVSPKTLKGALPQAFPKGTRLNFQQSAAPTGWVKEVDEKYNNVALRMTTGNVTTGGSKTFTDAFKNQSMNVSVSGSVSSTTLSESQMPYHTHSIPWGSNYSGIVGSTVGTGPAKGWFNSTSHAGASAPHTHGFLGASGSTNINLAVKYVDVIIATKS